MIWGICWFIFGFVAGVILENRYHFLQRINGYEK